MIHSNKKSIKSIILLYFLALSTSTFGQTIQELEYDLSWYKRTEVYGGKIESAKKLQKLDPFNYSATEYICRYYNDRKIDSVSMYFENLIANFPNNTEPYLLRAELLYLEFDYKTIQEHLKKKIEYLKLGLKINHKDYMINFKLAEIYYDDFMFPLEKEKNWGSIYDFGDKTSNSTLVNKERPIKKSKFVSSADSSLKYFYQAWDLENNSREIIYYPIRQLECYLKLTNNTNIPNDIEITFDQCYFPSSYFTTLTENWECDFSTNYLSEIESGITTAQNLKVQLVGLQENCLYINKTEQNTTIYRFTWLRSFHHPIAIRIKKTNNEVMLFWKVGKGASGYEPEGLKESGMKRLSLDEWANFERLINESNFDSLPNEKYTPKTDGATWTLERKSPELYKAHHTNWPSKELKEACLYLLSKTRIKVKEKNIY
jgi:hypothetical protein